MLLRRSCSAPPRDKPLMSKRIRFIVMPPTRSSNTFGDSSREVAPQGGVIAQPGWQVVRGRVSRQPAAVQRLSHYPKKLGESVSDMQVGICRERVFVADLKGHLRQWTP